MIAGIFESYLHTFSISHPYALTSAGMLLGMTSNLIYRIGRSDSSLRFWRVDNQYCWLSGFVAVLALALAIRIIAS